MTVDIRFYVNGVLTSLAPADTTETALTALRTRLRQTGSKEGCAEGDCGACTIVVGALEGDRVVYRAVNACILFLPELDGKDVITVEGVRGADGGLHPVQQAMVAAHGSQCGFCTPGFVMALYAHYLNEGATDRQTLKDVLAANLCRCTGYGPILEAGEKMGRSGADERPDPAESVQRLRRLARERPLDIRTGEKRYRAPRSLSDLQAMLAETPAATLLAGGTDIGLWVTKQRRSLADIVSLTGIEDLRRIEDRGDALRIGAAVRYTDLMDRLAGLWPDFDELLRRLGSVQVRNSGTIGGNIANGSPIGDGMPPLIALGATLRLVGPKGGREMPLEDYFIDYGRQDRRAGEFVAAITLPKPAPDQLFFCAKLSKRFDQDISALLLALSLTLEGGTISAARIACGGMAAVPKRAFKAEAALIGKPWSEDTARTAMAAIKGDFTPIDDMRSSAAYRQQAAQNLLLKAWLATSGDAEGGSLARREAADVR